jgi:hypothetical protein
MRACSLWHPILGIIGLVAWMLFILGCLGWSSWSPDSSRVIFAYAQPSARSIGIALYDRRRHTASSIFTESAEKEDDVPGLQAQWAADGKTIVIEVFGDKDIDIFIESLEVGTPTRHIHLGNVEQAIPPFPEIANVFYIRNDKEILQLSLKSGRVLNRNSQGAPYDQLFAVGDRLLYAKLTGSEKRAVEVGAIDLTDLRSMPLFQFQVQEPGLEIQLPIAPQPKGDEFAVVGKGKDRDSILVFNKEGLKQVLSPAGVSSQYRLGNLQWSNTGTKLYAGAVTPSPQNSDWQYSLAEFSLKGQLTRTTPLYRVKEEHFDPSKDTDFQLRLDISLSPDGSTISTSPALFDSDNIDEKDRALFLIDLRDPQRHVTRILVPESVPPQVSSSPGE